MSTNLLQQPTAHYRAKLGACDGLEEIGLVCPALREWARVLDAVVVAGQDDGTPPWSLRPRWALAHTFSHFRPSHLDVCTDKAVERKHNGPDVGGIDDRDPTNRRRDHRARFGPRTADLPVSEADRNADDTASTDGHMGQHVEDDTHVAWLGCARASVTAWRAVLNR